MSFPLSRWSARSWRLMIIGAVALLVVAAFAYWRSSSCTLAGVTLGNATKTSEHGISRQVTIRGWIGSFPKPGLIDASHTGLPPPKEQPPPHPGLLGRLVHSPGKYAMGTFLCRHLPDTLLTRWIRNSAFQGAMNATEDFGFVCPDPECTATNYLKDMLQALESQPRALVTVTGGFKNLSPLLGLFDYAREMSFTNLTIGDSIRYEGVLKHPHTNHPTKGYQY